MFKSKSLLRNSVLVIALLIAPLVGQAKTAQIPLTCKYIAPIEESFLTRHILYNSFSPKLEKRTIQQFIKSLDGSKLYLLRTDVAKIKKEMKGILKKTKSRDCQPIAQAHAILVKRVKERVDYARKQLGKNFKLDLKTEFILDPDKRQYAKNEKAANTFHRKYLQFQVANYVATGMALDEAKKNVIRGYERILSQLKEFKDSDLWALYLDSFARALDPHSSYLSADALEDFQIQMGLSLEGIGASLSSKDGFTVIEQLVPGGAAARSGKLRPKDKIIAVAQGENGKFENIIEMDLRDVVKKIRGPKGTKVRLSILRKDGKKTKRMEVTLTRAKINLKEQAASITYIDRKVKSGGRTAVRRIGVIDLPSFYADNREGGRSAARDMKELLQQAHKKQVDGLVLDLSTNGGGSLGDAVKIAGLFFKTGNVVKQSSRDPGKGEIELADEDPTVDYSGPLVVLVSRVSASASEIVSGTLKAYHRAVIVGGDHTFGKGTVQSVEQLPIGLGALKTTVGMFFIPSGISTQHHGVRADIIFPNTYSTDDIGEKTLDYSLPPAHIKSFLSKSAFVKTGPGAWKPVTESLILKLRKKSEKRIAKSKKFADIRKEIKKNKQNGKMIKLADMLKEREKAEEKIKKEDKKRDSKTGVLSEAERQQEYLDNPYIKEAVNVAVDYVDMSAPRVNVVQKKPPLNSAAKEN